MLSNAMIEPIKETVLYKGHKPIRLVMKKNTFKIFLFYITIVNNVSGQIVDSNVVYSNKKNVIYFFVDYNLAGTKYTDWINPTGIGTNLKDTLYHWKQIPKNTIGGLIEYNRNFFVSRCISISVGGGITYNSTFWKSIIYIDSSVYKPDISHKIKKIISIITPISLCYYSKRFIFSIGGNLQYPIFEQENTYFIDSRLISTCTKRFDIYCNFKESISYKLLKKRSFYFVVGAEQSKGFYKNKSYSNRIIIGSSFYFK